MDQQAVDNVQVQADGNGTLIGKLSSSDIMVYPVYNGVQGAGKTTLRLEARITNTDYTNVGIKLTVLSPQTVDVVFDTVGEKNTARYHRYQWYYHCRRLYPEPHYHHPQRSDSDRPDQ